MNYFDREGKPLELMEWAKKLEDLNYKRVASHFLSCGVWVSTVWLGMSDWQGGPSDNFETMAFYHLPRRLRKKLKARTDYRELTCRRYATEAEAIKGHLEVVKEFHEA